jgi:hypothetical protein
MQAGAVFPLRNMVYRYGYCCIEIVSSQFNYGSFLIHTGCWFVVAWQLVKSLPTVVPGCVIISQRVLVPSGDYELIYDVPGSGKLAALRKITHITTAYNQVFTIVFCAEQLGFDSCTDVARLMLSSFQTFEPENLRRLSSVSESGVASPSITSTPPDHSTAVTVKITNRPAPQPRQAMGDDGMAKQVSQVTVRSEAKGDVSQSSSTQPLEGASKRTETPTDVTAIQWKQDGNHPSGIRFSVPAKWSRLPSNKTARNPVVEYVCGRHETAFKSFKLLTVDLSAATISVPEAIQEFTEHYRQQILRQSQGQVGDTLISLVHCPVVQHWGLTIVLMLFGPHAFRESLGLQMNGE